MLTAESIPDEIMRNLELISRSRNIDLEYLVERFVEIVNDPNTNSIVHNPNDINEKFNVALIMLRSEALDSIPTKVFTVVPVGFSGVRVSKKRNEPMRTMYAIVLENNRATLRRIICRGKFSDVVKSIQLFSKYTVRLGEFGDGTMVVTERSRWNTPEPALKDMSHDTISSLFNKLGVPRVTINQASQYPSRKGSDGFTIDTDWRVVRGWIVREYMGERKDGTKFGTYTIIDHECPLDDRVLPDGKVIPPGMTVWIAPDLMKYQGECDFYGTIEVDEHGIAFMNAFLVVPVHAWNK